MSKNLLASCLIKEVQFKPKALGGDKEITIRQLTIDENEKVRDFFKEEKQKDGIFYAVKCAMVEPEFFAEDQLKKLNQTGANLINEIFAELPVIGKTKKEREEHFGALAKLIKEESENENKPDAKAEVESEEKK